MSKTGREILNMKAQLEQYGVRLEALFKTKINNTRIDTIGLDFLTPLQDLDAQQNCNKYRWNGLPDNLTSWLIEYMVYIKGSLCGYIRGGILYILPYANNAAINIYGLPTKVKPLSFNGTQDGTEQGIELMIDYSGKPSENAKACILYDRIPAFNPSAPIQSRALLNKVLLENEANILGRIKNNLRNIDKKAVFYVDSAAQANQMTNDIIDAYGTDLPFIVLVRNPAQNGNDMQDTLQGDIANETQSLFEAFQSYNSIRCMISGISNDGAFEKKERKLNGELEDDKTQTDLVTDAGLYMRRLFLAQLKLIYPEYKEMLDKITVEINQSEREEEKAEAEEDGQEDYNGGANE